MQADVIVISPVTVRESDSAQRSGTIPLGPEALGYLTRTSDGYAFVRLLVPKPAPLVRQDVPEWAPDFEEGCF